LARPWPGWTSRWRPSCPCSCLTTTGRLPEPGRAHPVVLT
jgi:hypothetical protein